MTDSAEAQLRRVLAMVPELADDEEHGIDDLARELGVAHETLLADLCALAERYDDPAGFIDEGVALYIEQERVSLSSPHFRRPMRVTLSELCALELGLAMLEAERPPEERQAITRAREQLRGVIAVLPAHAPASDPESRHATLANDATSAAHLGVVRAAARERQKVRIDYRRSDGVRSGARVVRPYAVVVASGAWYLVAHCERAEAVRIFRLDRVMEVERVDGAFDVPAAFSLDDMVRGGKVLAVDQAVATMRVRYSPRIARWVAEREGRAVDPDGAITVVHAVTDTSWAVRHVLQYGPDAEVLEPATLREEIVRRLRAPG